MIRVELERYRSVLSRPVGSALSRHADREGLLLRLQDDDGRVAIGEAAPLPGYANDSLASAERELAALGPRHFEGAVDTPPLELARTLIERLGWSSPAARFALETALLDRQGQRKGKPVHMLLRADAPAPVPLSSLLPLDAAEETFEAAQRAVDAGITTVKLKIGHDLEAERTIVAALRERYPSLAIRLDANGALPPGEASAILHRFAVHRIELVEEPVGFEDLRARAPLPIPVALDESLQDLSVDAVADAVREVHAEAIVLKPMALGGFSPCLALARVAKECGVGVIVTHLFDGPVALAAASELALALSPILPAGLAPHAVTDAFPDVAIASRGVASIQSHSVPGLGVLVATASSPYSSP